MRECLMEEPEVCIGVKVGSIIVSGQTNFSEQVVLEHTRKTLITMAFSTSLQKPSSYVFL